MDERLQEQASLYALGALDADELEAFEAVLREDAQLRALVRELRAVTEAIAGTSPAVVPPPALKARLLLAIEDARQPSSTQARQNAASSWLPWALAAGFALLGVFAFWQRGSLRAQLTAQTRLIEELRMSAQLELAENQDLRLSVARLRESNRLANVRIALLDSVLSSAPKAVAVSVWDNDRQDGVFIVHSLKPPPANKDYQLWVIDPKYAVPVDAGVFHVDAQGSVRVDFRAKKPIVMADKFAVTIENKGGSDLPTTTAMVLVGS